MIKYKDPVTGRWVNLPYIPGNSGLPVVMPEMFGAKGDGKTDDSAAIQNAILNCGDFGTVYFSNKPYRITRSISVDRKINIEGRGCSINVDCEDVIPAALHFTNQRDMTRTVIRDVFVRCRKKAINGFRIGDGNAEATQITIDNCKVTQALEDGFKVVPMAYCIRFQDCYAESNGYSGISAVSTDYSHQMNAVSIAGCTLILNRRHGAHINGINIVVENCVIECNGMKPVEVDGKTQYVRADQDLVEECPGSGIYIGCPENPKCSSSNTVVRNNYFEPSYEAQITTCLDGVSLRVLNNYFLVGGSRRPEGHRVTNVKCIQPVDENGDGYGWVSLTYQNNTSANAREGEDFKDVDGGGMLTERSDIYAQYTVNTQLARVSYEEAGGNRLYYPVPLSGEDPYRTVDLVTSERKSFTIYLPPLRPGAVLKDIGFSTYTEGYDAAVDKPVVRVGICVTRNGVTLEKTFDHGIAPGSDEKNFLMQDRKWIRKHDSLEVQFPWFNIPRDAKVSLSFTLLNTRQATKIEIFDPYINLYHC